MDGKGRLGVRNWDFSGQLASADQEGFLKMSAYNQGRSSSGLPEGSTETTVTKTWMNFAWVPQRNFPSTATKPSIPTILPSMDNNYNGDANANASGNDHFESDEPTKCGKMKKTAAADDSRPKQPSVSKKKKKNNNASSASTGKREKRNLDVVVAEGVTFDFSGVPTPICSCTGVSRQCYKWGAGGWQSSCCTTTISEYPLPMSTSRPGSRLAGRKMSNGAYGKLLQRLAIEGYDLSNAIDLKNHWARHGTNKFVTIR